jgi:hypothetical protein
MQIQLCEGRVAVAEIVESESLPRLKLDAGFIAAGRILSVAIMLALRGVLPFVFVEGKNPMVRLRIEHINNGQETPYRSPYR